VLTIISRPLSCKEEYANCPLPWPPSVSRSRQANKMLGCRITHDCYIIGINCLICSNMLTFREESDTGENHQSCRMTLSRDV